jgi:hypothetical protein
MMGICGIELIVCFLMIIICMQYPAEEASNHSWQKKESMSGKGALEKCECIMRLQYRHHWGWFKKMFGFFILFLSIALLIWNEVNKILIVLGYPTGN